MATIRDVARSLQACPWPPSPTRSTVRSRSAPSLLARVRAAVEKLSFTPRCWRARACASVRAACWASSSATSPTRSSPELFEADRACRRGARLLGASVQFERAHASARRAHLRMLRSQRIDGLILAPTGTASMNRAALLAAARSAGRAGRPRHGRARLRCRGRSTTTAPRYRGDVPSDRAAAIGASRLINGPRRVRTAADRLQGYREALLAAGLPFDPALVPRRRLPRAARL